MCRRLLAILAVVFLVAGCKVDVVMDVAVHDDGSGLVTVSVGLDDEALALAGNLGRQLRTDDLVSAGWNVTGPAREGDTTWVRASKPFSEPSAAAAVLAEVSAPEGPFRDFTVTRSEGLLGTEHSVTGTVDLTRGPQVFSDADLAALLGGDPFGGTLEAIVAERGPIDDLVDISVRVDLPGGDPVTTSASFSDASPTQVDVSSSESSTLARAGLWFLVGVVVLGAAVVVAVLVMRSRRRI